MSPNPNYAPIALFLYNRADHSNKTIEALKQNSLAKESELFVFCDGPKNEADLIKTSEVVVLAQNISGFKNVTVQSLPLNRGLSKSIITGVGKIFETYEKVIVLEDDIVTAPNFLKFTNLALDFYKKEARTFSITGFNFPLKTFPESQNYTDDIFYVRTRGCSWGWATWKDRWQEVDFSVPQYDEFKRSKKQQAFFNKYGSNLGEMLRLQMSGKIDSWAIRVSYHQFRNNLLTIFPTKTLVQNIGFDGSGSHGDNNPNLSEVFFVSGGKDFIFKEINDLKNNSVMEKFYVQTASGGVKKILSKKSALRLEYMTVGFIIAQIVNLIFYKL